MSRSDLYGNTDRRKRLPEIQIFVKDSLEELYAEPRKRGLFAQSDRVQLETSAFKCAIKDLDEKDRKQIGEHKIRLMEHIGKNFGEASAEQVLAKLGIFLLEAEKQHM